MKPYHLAFMVLIACTLLLTLSCEGCDDDDDDDSADDDDDTGGDDDDDTDDDDDDDLEPRSFYLSAAPMHYRFSAFDIDTVFDTTGFDGLVDMVSVHQDFFGLPWDEFKTDADLPQAWVDEMEDVRDQIEDLGAGCFLSVTPLNGFRSGLAPKAYDDGGELEIGDEDWSLCYDFDTGPDHEAMRNAYLAYVRWMVDFFSPDFLNIVIEMNMYDDNCPDQYPALIDLANAAYDQEKAIDADLPVFPSFTIGDYWDFGEGGECLPGDRTCFEAAVARDDTIKRDRFGISSYPLFQFGNLTMLPEDYYSAILDYRPEPPVFAEIGTTNMPVIGPFPNYGDPCLLMIDTSDAEQIWFMEFLFNEAQEHGSDLICWWCLRDFVIRDVLENCPCDAPGLWCPLYEAVYDVGLGPAWLMWGGMGIMEYDQTRKLSQDLWEEWMARPVE